MIYLPLEALAVFAPLKSPVKECRHLGSGDKHVRTVCGVLRTPATAGYASRGNTVDVARVCAPLNNIRKAG